MKIQIRFDDAPAHVAGHFVEAEDENGAGISVGEWVEEGDFWLLKIDTENVLSQSQVSRAARR